MADRYLHVFKTPTHCTYCGCRPTDDDAADECAVRLRAEVDRLTARVLALEEKYCSHNVAAILTVDGNNRLRGVL